MASQRGSGAFIADNLRRLLPQSAADDYDRCWLNIQP